MMEMIYAAYGLRLSSSFALPGMSPATDDCDSLPTLTVALQDPAELEHHWSGSADPPEWRGHQGDGHELTIESGSAGDRLFTYGALARFHLGPDMLRLDCSPQRPGLDWQRILLGKIIPSISVMRGYEALHAAAVDSGDGVVAIMAPSGSGKSTLALELVRRGWQLFADDVLTLSIANGTVSAHPGTPHMNIAQSLAPGIDPQELGTQLDEFSDELWLRAHTSETRVRPVRVLCQLQRAADLALKITKLSASPLVLAPYILGLSSDPERQRTRFCLYADLMQSASLVRLTAGLEHSPAQLADLVERELAYQPALTFGASK